MAAWCVPAKLSGMRGRSAVIEIVVLTALILSYIWLWRDAFAGHGVVFGVAVLALLVWSHRHRGEGTAEIGFRLDNLGPAAVQAGLVLGPLLGLVLLAGAWGGSFGFPPLIRWPSTLGWMMLGGLLQQYVLLGFYYRRFSNVVEGPWTASVGAALVFGLAHLPNPFLTILGPVLGVVSCWLYRRIPNLLALGVAHGALSFAFYYGLPRSLTFGLRVGPGFFDF